MFKGKLIKEEKMKSRENSNQKRKIIAVVFSLAVIWTWSEAAVAQTIDTLWCENFEENVWDRWYVTNGSWEVGTPTSGPDTAHSGVQCAATVLDGNYLDNQDSRLIRIQSFVVPTGPNPRLRFWHFYSFHNGDYGQVQLKVEGDSIWQTLDFGIYGNIGGSGGYHSSNRWTRPLLDLSEYSGQVVQLAFRFRSVDASYGNDVSTGCYIDEVLIETGNFIFNNPQDWESGIEYWYADFGVWEVGEPTSGPAQAYSGLNCAGTILDGNYYDNLNSRLISPSIIIPATIHNPRLRLWHYYSFHNGDYGEVQIRSVGDTVWNTLYNGHYNGNSGGIWASPYFSLIDYAGQTVQFAFRFKSVDASYGNDVSSGWYIDSISVQADDIGAITGQVTTSTGDTVQGAYLRLVNTGINAITDSLGVYTMSLIEPDTYDLTCYHPDLGDILITDLLVTANDTIYLDIEFVISGVESEFDVIPSAFTLDQNYPNPFNPQTTISYSLPAQSDVSVHIYNLLGQKVSTLFEGSQQAGEHSVTWDAGDFPSGVYFARVEAPEATKSIKMTLMK
jgi:hypothetical protein